MELNKQVCNLANAKRLKELNVKQVSLFWWVVDEQDRWEKLPSRIVYDEKVTDYESYWNRYSAFTVAEIGEMLPDNYHSFRKGGDKKYRCELDRQLWKFQKDIPVEEADTEADARAKMLIYLLENKLIELN